MIKARTPRVLMTAATLVLALAAAACGSDASKTETGGSGKTADQKAVEASIQKAIDAENDKDVETFLSLWTDKGLEAYDAGSRADLEAGKVESFGQDKIKITAFPETTVTGDTAVATVDATPEEFQVAQVMYRVKISAIKKDGDWVLDGFEFVGSPPAASGADKIDIKAQEYAFILDKDKTKGNTAWTLTNTGKEQHELTLYKTPDGVDLATARKAVEDVDGENLESIPDGYKVDHVSFVEPGKSADVTFAAPLAAGTYLLACYIPQGGFGEQGPVNPDGKPHIKLGMASLLTVS